MKNTTREWVKKAEQDYVLAQQGSQSEVPLHDGVCFHCQQCAEKYLKGLMEELGLPVPKTHFLDLLLSALKPYHPTLRSLRRGLLFLSVFAVDTRYPGNSASKRQAVAALRWAGRVRTPARESSEAVPPSSWLSSASSRCCGSMYPLSAASAMLCASASACWNLVVSLSRRMDCPGFIKP